MPETEAATTPYPSMVINGVQVPFTDEYQATLNAEPYTYFTGTTTNEWGNTFSQCYGFAEYAYHKLFNKWRSDPMTNKTNAGIALKNLKSYFINNVTPGSHIRFGDTDDRGHSIIVIECTNDHITFYDANRQADNGVRYSSMSWDGFYALPGSNHTKSMASVGWIGSASVSL